MKEQKTVQEAQGVKKVQKQQKWNICNTYVQQRKHTKSL